MELPGGFFAVGAKIGVAVGGPLLGFRSCEIRGTLGKEIDPFTDLEANTKHRSAPEGGRDEFIGRDEIFPEANVRGRLRHTGPVSEQAVKAVEDVPAIA